MKVTFFCLFLTFLGLVQGGPNNHFVSYLKRLTSEGHFDQLTRLSPLPFQTSLSGNLNASPSLISLQNSSITVAWQNIEEPQAGDWLGVYFPTSPNDDYLDFYPLREVPPSQRGSGSVTLSLTNLRSDLQFRYFRAKEGSYELVAESNLVSFLDEPLHGHVALGDRFDQMRVMFTTTTADTPIVEYGEISGQYTHSATGSSATYTANMICGSPANKRSPMYFIDPGFLHDVLLSGLKPRTKYYYRYGTKSIGFSEEKSFRTAPLPGTPSTRFIAFGDLGVTTPGPQSTVELVLQEIEEADMILHFGDLSYAFGRGYMWDAYMEFIEPIASRSPYMVSIGNHEYCYLEGGERDPSGAGAPWVPEWGNMENDSGGECGVPMYYRFTMPGNGNSLFWYSFNYGNVHVIQISTEHDYTPGSDMYVWMEQDLAKVNRTETPFIVFTAHRPMYNSERYYDDYRVCQGMQYSFEDLLIKYKVDVALYGHYHSYERTCPVYKNECDEENGLVHITVGSAGAWLDQVDHFDVPWSFFTLQEFGYCRLTSTEKELLVEFIYNDEAAVVDSVAFPNRWG